MAVDKASGSDKHCRGQKKLPGCIRLRSIVCFKQDRQREDEYTHTPTARRKLRFSRPQGPCPSAEPSCPHPGSLLSRSSQSSSITTRSTPISQLSFLAFFLSRAYFWPAFLPSPPPSTSFHSSHHFAACSLLLITLVSMFIKQIFAWLLRQLSFLSAKLRPLRNTAPGYSDVDYRGHVIIFSANVALSCHSPRLSLSAAYLSLRSFFLVPPNSGEIALLRSVTQPPPRLIM